jgi:hypothetical protein
MKVVKDNEYLTERTNIEPYFPPCMIHPAFGIFQDVMNLPVTDLLKHAYFANVNEIASTLNLGSLEVLEKEDVRRGFLFSALSELLSSPVALSELLSSPVALGVKNRDIGLVHKSFSLLIVEVKNELGTGGCDVPEVQLYGYFRDAYFTALKSSKRAKRSDSLTLTSNQGSVAGDNASLENSEGKIQEYTCRSRIEKAFNKGDPCPALGICWTGIVLQVFAVWLGSKISLFPLALVSQGRGTGVSYHPYNDKEYVSDLKRVLIALKCSVTSLVQHYDGLDKSLNNGEIANLNSAAEIPYSPFRAFEDVRNRRALGILQLPIENWGLDITRCLLDEETYLSLKRHVFIGIMGPSRVTTSIVLSGGGKRKSTDTVDSTKTVDSQQSKYLKYVPVEKEAFDFSFTRGKSAVIFPSSSQEFANLISLHDVHDIHTSLPVIVKYLRRENYPVELHHTLAQRGIVPKLYCACSLPGGLVMLVMEYLHPDDHWQPLSKVQDDLEQLMHPVQACVERFHSVYNNNPVIVHGDLRNNNILVRKSPDVSCYTTEDVRIVDLDWMGEEGVMTYPMTITRFVSYVDDSIRGGSVILKLHDVKHVQNIFNPHV